jgi:O-antigen/teichoic acid export membrane protein
MPGAGSIAHCGEYRQAAVANEAGVSSNVVRPFVTSNMRVARNTLVLVALRVFMPALAVGLVLMLSRFLGVEGLGRYTLAFSFLYLFNAIAPLGLGAIITRDGARDKAMLNSMLSNAMTLGTIASLLLTVAMAGVAYLSDYDSGTRTAILILSLALFPCTVGLFQDSAFIALERMDYLALGTLVEYIIKVGVGMLLLLLGFGLNSVLFMAVIGRVVGCIISAILLKRVALNTRWSYDPEIVHRLMKLAPTFLLIGIFATLYWRIDIFMLSKLQPVEQVGYYGAAWRILELAMVVPQSLCLALYPRISASALSDLPQLQKIGRGAMRYLLALSLPAAIGVTLLAGPILQLLYGEAFRTAAHTLSVLILTLVPYGIVRYHAYVLVGANHQRIDLALNIIMSVLNIVLNFVLIPRYGHLGAAIATFVSICAYGILQYGYLFRRLPGWAASITIPTPIIIGCLALTSWVWLFREYNVMFVIPIAALIYGTCLIVGGFFSPSELKLLGLDRLRIGSKRP